MTEARTHKANLEQKPFKANLEQKPFKANLQQKHQSHPRPWALLYAVQVDWHLDSQELRRYQAAATTESLGAFAPPAPPRRAISCPSVAQVPVSSPVHTPSLLRLAEPCCILVAAS
jgi:hypothetical protein